MNEDVEDSIGEFVDLESDLRDLAEREAVPGTTAGPGHGTVVGADRVDRDSVPDGYPVPVTGEDALALELEVDGRGTEVVFLDWPDAGAGIEHIEQLLATVGVGLDSFADLYGEPIPLAVRDGHLVAALDYGGPTPNRRSADDYEVIETGRTTAGSDQVVDTPGKNMARRLLVLSLVLVGVLYEMAFRGGIAAVTVVVWFVVAFFLWAHTHESRDWVNARVDGELSAWWPTLALLVPPVATPLYLLQQYRALRAASLERTAPRHIYQTDHDLGSVVAHYDGTAARIVLLQGGVRIQSLDTDPRSAVGASYSFREIDAVTHPESSDRAGVTLVVSGGSRAVLDVDFPRQPDTDPAVVAGAVNRQRRIWQVLQSTDADPETLIVTETDVVALTAENVHISRRGGETTHIPLDHLGRVGLDFETQHRETNAGVADSRRQYAYFENASLDAAPERVKRVYCHDLTDAFQRLVGRVDELREANATGGAADSATSREGGGNGR